VNWAEQRADMVERQLKRRGIHDQRVLAAFLEIPREEFLPESTQHLAYRDEPADIGFGQTISQPYMTALMVQTLRLGGSEKVLEVGGGSGYHAAVLGALSARVISIEFVPELAETARQNLFRTGRDHNITVVAGDGSRGYPPDMPYDAVSVAAAAPDVPEALLDQLNESGRMVIPVGSRDDQDLLFIVKSGGKFDRQVASLCRFVPLRGDQGWK
jgi:protein-L-isoaspartate(D-aspartate) O-methyltransferase